MDDPLSRILREEKQTIEQDQLSKSDTDLQEPISTLSISHSHNEWILPSGNQTDEEAEIHREQIKITVTDPRKHKSNMDSFVNYLIITRTFNDGVQIKESNVRRRYNDFIWLRNILEQKYPFHILSPLPLKHSISKKFNVVADDGEFIRRRMIGMFK